MSAWLENKEAYRHYYDSHTVDKADPYRGYMGHFHPQDGESIVDLGCGTGATVHHFTKLGHEVTGVECGKPYISQCHNQDGVFVESLIEEWVPDKRYDWALLTEVLEHVIDPAECLKVAREAADNLFVTAPTIKVGTEVHVRGVSPYELNEWLKEAGWTCKSMGLAFAHLGRQTYQQVVCEAL